jgi:hypothetical protein
MIFEKANKDYGVQFSEAAMSRVISFETDVKQVLQKVAMGEAEAGSGQPIRLTNTMGCNPFRALQAREERTTP